MIHIRKTQAPAKFIKENKIYKCHFDDMDTEVKNKLRQSLLQDQGYICAYCMSAIENNAKSTKIEHYVPRNDSNEMKYKNLLAVCYGGEGSSDKQQTCDTHKKQKVLTINPQIQKDIETIYYKHDGSIVSNDKKYNEEINNILNLNVQVLKDKRKHAWDAVKNILIKKCKEKAFKKGDLERIYRKYLEKDGSGRHIPYCGIVLWNIKRKIVKL